MLDLISYIIGLQKGKRDVTLDTANYTFTDDGEGNITIEIAEETEEENG